MKYQFYVETDEEIDVPSYYNLTWTEGDDEYQCFETHCLPEVAETINEFLSQFGEASFQEIK